MLRPTYRNIINVVNNTGMITTGTSKMVGNGLMINIREYAKKSEKKDPADESKTDTQKILEKAGVPRIIDYNDTQYGMLKYLKYAQNRIAERELNQEARPDSKYKGVFKMMSSVIIERFPSLVPLPTEYEQKYMDAKQRVMELANRKPLRMIDLVEDLPEFQVVNTKEKKIQTKEVDEDNELGALKESLEQQRKQQQQAEQEEEEGEYEEDFDKFVPEPRETEADRKGDRKSLNRALDKSLYLIVKKGLEWQFPSTAWIEGESMKNAAERALRDTTGTDYTYWIPSQAPCGVSKLILDKKEQDLLKAEGIKNFYYRSHYFSGDIKVNGDYLWITKDEMIKYFTKDYLQQTHRLIFDDCYYAYINE